jgi:hypothetical protein
MIVIVKLFVEILVLDSCERGIVVDKDIAVA